MIVKTQSLAGEFVHVDELDPSLDRPADDAPAAVVEKFRHAYQRALETSDLASLPIKNGSPPVVWRFRHLSADEIAWLVDRAAIEGAGLRLSLDILALALVGVNGVQDELGKPFVLARARDAARNGFTAVKREQLDLLLRDESGRLDSPRLGRLAGRIWQELNPRNG